MSSCCLWYFCVCPSGRALGLLCTRRRTRQTSWGPGLWKSLILLRWCRFPSRTKARPQLILLRPAGGDMSLLQHQRGLGAVFPLQVQAVGEVVFPPQEGVEVIRHQQNLRRGKGRSFNTWNKDFYTTSADLVTLFLPAPRWTAAWWRSRSWSWRCRRRSRGARAPGTERSRRAGRRTPRRCSSRLGDEKACIIYMIYSFICPTHVIFNILYIYIILYIIYIYTH